MPKRAPGAPVAVDLAAPVASLSTSLIIFSGVAQDVFLFICSHKLLSQMLAFIKGWIHMSTLERRI